ncbi:TIR domain-containing protein [Tenacibaculum sp. ZH5_bin.1]|uniref:TIR domain-containing protein n=1 Tax=Tenacibaculum TaxID=104267 RepID=UPI001431AE7A|nr:TIR domain-containing protein [Tenacibaculum mesophilum]KAF9658504.1 TIR domain-containing protein [Tenacibaculum mesophilum]
MEYLISKLSFRPDGQLIEDVLISPTDGKTVENFETKNRSWLVQKYNEGHTIGGIFKSTNGNWFRKGDFRMEEGYFKWGYGLPGNISKRNVFVSYYHNDDQEKREHFDNLFGDLIINQSVMMEEIDGENSDDYIHRLINEGYMKDTTVLAVLLGPKTQCRMHVDWEIGGALNRKVGDRYAGLLGIRLPSHADYGLGDTYNEDNYSERFMANIDSGYAVVIDWTENRKKLQDAIEMAFSRRSESERIVNTSIPRLKKNLCS